MVATHYAKKLASAALEIGAVKLNPERPFQWASGYRMPIYNDNRMFLFYPEYRNLIKYGLVDLMVDNDIRHDIIAGTSTAGISPGISLADVLNAPFVYVRDKPKDHGLKNQIEGISETTDLANRKVTLIEDLISTGGSSVKAVRALRKANGVVDNCLSIFNYGLPEADKLFSDLNPKCSVNSILYYDTILDVAIETGYINENQFDMLKEWRENPFEWGEKHGFPRIVD